MPLAKLELTISVYQSDTHSISTLDLEDPIPSRYPSYPAHRVQFCLYRQRWVRMSCNFSNYIVSLQRVQSYSQTQIEVSGFIHTALRNHPILNILNLYSSHFKYIIVMYPPKIMHLTIKRQYFKKNTCTLRLPSTIQISSMRIKDFEHHITTKIGCNGNTPYC